MKRLFLTLLGIFIWYHLHYCKTLSKSVYFVKFQILFNPIFLFQKCEFLINSFFREVISTTINHAPLFLSLSAYLSVFDIILKGFTLFCLLCFHIETKSQMHDHSTYYEHFVLDLYIFFNPIYCLSNIFVSKLSAFYQGASLRKYPSLL